MILCSIRTQFYSKCILFCCKLYVLFFSTFIFSFLSSMHILCFMFCPVLHVLYFKCIIYSTHVLFYLRKILSNFYYFFHVLSVLFHFSLNVFFPFSYVMHFTLHCNLCHTQSILYVFTSIYHVLHLIYSFVNPFHSTQHVFNSMIYQILYHHTYIH